MKVVTQKDNHHVKIITGNGGSDLRFIYNILKENEKDYCNIVVHVSIGDPNALKHKSLKGIFNFIKMDKDRLYIVVIDKEHIKGEINENMLKQNAIGIEIVNIVEINEKTYRISCKVGSRECVIYLLVLGTSCCFEEEVLRLISNDPLPDYSEEGCCRDYKKLLREYQDNKNVNFYQDSKVKEHFYEKFKQILGEINNIAVRSST